MKLLKHYIEKLTEVLLLYRMRVTMKLWLNESQSRNSDFFFIISCGRSGTTLLRKLLMERGDIHIPPETYDGIPQAMKLYYQNRKKNWSTKVGQVLDFFQNASFYEFWELDMPCVKRELLNLPLEEQNFRSIIYQIYVQHRNQHSPEAVLLGDKTPYLILRLPWIKILYPNARIIHIVRDGHDVISSRMKNLNESFDVALNRWKWSIKESKKFKRYYRESFMQVRYEDLVEASDTHIQEITRFLGLKGGSQLVKREVNLGDDGQAHHQMLHEVITNKKVGAGRNVFNDEEKRQIEKKIGRLLRKFDYLP